MYVEHILYLDSWMDTFLDVHASTPTFALISCQGQDIQKINSNIILVIEKTMNLEHACSTSICFLYAMANK